MPLPSVFRRHRPAAAAPVIQRPRLFSTDFEGDAVSSGAVAGWFLDKLKAAAPKPLAGAEGMDGFDFGASCKVSDLGAPNISETLFQWFALQTFIGHQMAAIVAQHWLIDKACSMPARDAIRMGYDVTLPDGGEQNDKIKAAVRKADKAYRVNYQMQEYIRKGRIFGIRIALFRVESTDPQYYEFPFNPDAVTPGSYKGIVQIDPYWCIPLLDGPSVQDPASPSFYEPTWWQINGKKYHKSHLAIFRTSQPPDLLKPMYLYGGIPVPQKIMERVYAAERTANETPQLAMSKRLTVWNTDIAAVLANQDKFAEHMRNFMFFRDNFGMKVNDTEDKMEQFDTTLAGLDDITKTQYEIVAAAANVPVTKLLGSTPKGFNSTGDYEESSYHEELETIQENDLTPFLDRHHLMIARSEIEPKFGMSPGSLTIDTEWKPLDSPDAKEYAEINYAKAQTDDLLANAGAIDGEDIRKRIRAEKDSGYTGISATPPEPAVDPTTIKVNPSKPMNIQEKPNAVS